MEGRSCGSPLFTANDKENSNDEKIETDAPRGRVQEDRHRRLRRQ